MRDPLPALTLYGTFREHHCIFFGVADKLRGLPSEHPRPQDRRLVALVAFGVRQFLTWGGQGLFCTEENQCIVLSPAPRHLYVGKLRPGGPHSESATS